MRGLVWDGTHFFFRAATGQQVRVPAEAEADLRGFLELFRVTFGRDPGPGDPIVFDPREDTPRPLPEAEMQAGVRDLLRALGGHPAYRHAHEQLGFVLTPENAKYSRPEDIAKWNEAVTAWCQAHPQAPPPPGSAVSIPPGQPEARRFAPAYAAVQEALAHAEWYHAELGRRVIAVLAVQPGGQPVRVLYYPAFVRACYQRRQWSRFRGRHVLASPTLFAFARHVRQGWIPVAIAYGADAPGCAFLPVQAGVALTGADLATVYEEGRAELCAPLDGSDSPG